jgi:N-acetylglucosamine-6-sulfatase
MRRTVAALLAAILGCSGAQKAPSGKRPNVVVVFTDDQRWDAMSGAGHPFLKTPNLDRLAREGVRFANAFCTTSLCSPSRASMLSGLYAHAHGVLDNFTDFPADLPSYPRRLKEEGYETAYIGKWHMGEANDEPRPGFDFWMSHKGQGNYFDTTFNINGKRELLEGYYTARVTEKAVEWIRRPHERPFLLVLGHKASHGPFQSEPRHARAFDALPMKRPATAGDTGPGKPDWVRQRVTTWHGIDGPIYKACGFEGYEDFVRGYYGTLLSVDQSVGEVTRALEESGLLEDTLVVFTTDNGFLLGEHGAIDKRAMWEESIRVPMIARYPRLFRAGTVVEEQVLHIDLAPSILDLCGARPIEKAHGLSWRRLAEGARVPWRTSWLYEYNYERQFPYTPNVRGVRTAGWKYIRYPHGDGGPDRWKAELYDLRDDPLETRNLIDDPRAAARLSELQAELARLQRETGGLPDRMPLDEGIKQTLPEATHQAVEKSGAEKK